MALVKCPKCGSLVSDKGEACPVCGTRLKASPRPPASPVKASAAPPSPPVKSPPAPPAPPVKPSPEPSSPRPLPEQRPESPAPEKSTSSRSSVWIISAALVIVVIVLAGLWIIPRLGEDESERTKREVRESVEKWNRLYKSHDAVALSRMYSLSVRYYAKVYSNDDIFTTFQEKFLDNPESGRSISDIMVTPLSETVYEARFTSHHGGGEGTSGAAKSYLWLERQDGGWKIIRQSDERSDANLSAMYQKKLSSMKIKASDGRYTYYLNRDSKKNLSTLYRWDSRTDLIEVLLNAGPEGCTMLPISFSKEKTTIDAVEDVSILEDGRLRITGKRPRHGTAPVYLFDMLSGRCDRLKATE